MNDIEILEKLLKKDKCDIGYYMAYIFDEKEKQAIENLIQKNKSLEQENSFLKMMYRGTDEFKAIEKLAEEE